MPWSVLRSPKSALIRKDLFQGSISSAQVQINHMKYQNLFSLTDLNVLLGGEASTRVALVLQIAIFNTGQVSAIEL